MVVAWLFIVVHCFCLWFGLFFIVLCIGLACVHCVCLVFIGFAIVLACFCYYVVYGVGSVVHCFVSLFSFICLLKDPPLDGGTLGKESQNHRQHNEKTSKNNSGYSEKKLNK